MKSLKRIKRQKGEVTNMVKRVEEVWYVAIDGKKFKTKKEAFLHEKSLKTTYVYLSYEPIDGQLGKFDTNVIMKVIGDRNFAEDLVRDFCHREFGQQLYENDDEQLVRNWFISGTSTEESYLKSNSKREILATIDVRPKADRDYEDQLLSLVDLNESIAINEETGVGRKAFCENCWDMVTYSVCDVCSSKDIKGETVKYTGRVAICSGCNESLFVPEIRDYNLNELSKQQGLLNG